MPTLRLLAMSLALATSLAAAPARPVHVALIFDDGPTVEQRGKFLELFAAEKIHVTFGTVAQHVEEHPDLARATLAAGHECANHSYAHLHPNDLDDAALAHEIVTSQQILTRILGTAPVWYWPPFLEDDPRMPALFAQTGLKRFYPHHLVVSFDYDPAVPADQIFARGTKDITDGTVILFHEWRPETLAQMPAILAELRRQGCVFLTFSEMDHYLAGLAAAP